MHATRKALCKFFFPETSCSIRAWLTTPILGVTQLHYILATFYGLQCLITYNTETSMTVSHDIAVNILITFLPTFTLLVLQKLPMEKRSESVFQLEPA